VRCNVLRLRRFRAQPAPYRELRGPGAERLSSSISGTPLPSIDRAEVHGSRFIIPLFGGYARLRRLACHRSVTFGPPPAPVETRSGGAKKGGFGRRRLGTRAPIGRAVRRDGGCSAGSTRLSVT
jgi:hypothetical protein